MMKIERVGLYNGHFMILQVINRQVDKIASLSLINNHIAAPIASPITP